MGDCEACNGSGEGMFADTRCDVCHGKGTAPRCPVEVEAEND